LDIAFVIELSEVTKSYIFNGKEVPILKGISVFIAAGEFVSIMGPSGSGKSTLSAILGCLAAPSGGVYKLNGRDVSGLPADELARIRNKSIGFIFQDFNLLSGLTALENVELPLVYADVPPNQRRDRAMACLVAVGLEKKAQNKPSQLSGGQKQRVAIARSLVNEPSFLFADEPTGALDKKTGHEILTIMQNLNIQGHTVIQVTHSPADAAYSKRILHLVDGSIIREETVERPTLGAIAETAESDQSELISRLWRIAQNIRETSRDDIPALSSLIVKSAAREAQIAAAKAVLRWSDYNVEQIVQSLFNSPDWVVRAELLKNIKYRSQQYSVPFYIKALSDEHAWVRHVAMTEIKSIDQKHFSDDQQKIILGSLEDLDERVRASAVFLVGKWQIPQKNSVIDRFLKDTNNRVRANAVECISGHDLEMAFMNTLIKMCDSERNNRVKANAAMIVSKHKPEVAFKAAADMLRSPDVMLRASGAWLFGMMQDLRGHQMLIELLKAETAEFVANQVIKSLSKVATENFPLREQIRHALTESQNV